MFTPGERIPLEEIRSRHARCREMLARTIPAAGGLLVTGTPNIYYMTGTTANGLAWLPLEGDPVLFVRKGYDRATMESPLAIMPFRSYKELPRLCAEAGVPLSGTIAADQAGVSWEQGRMLAERLADHRFAPADMVIMRTRAVKSEWEIAKMRRSAHGLFLSHKRLAEHIRPGMTEHDISLALWTRLSDYGSMGLSPTGMHGSTVLLGHICAGENGNYATAYDGPLGIKGEHPASPVMGHAGAVWEKGRILTVDSGFNWEGYIADRTQVYFAGKNAEIPAVVRKSHDAAMMILERISGMLGPGAIPSAIYAESLKLAGAAGVGENFMGIGDNQVRFVGHGIGLTVSEWPIFAKGFGEPLQPGMIVALEPKIGIPGVGMVGVENTYEITADGARSLSGDEDDIICV